MKELLEILETCCPDVDFEHETALIDDGILTSLDIVMIVDELEPENFNSAEAILALVERLRCD